MTIATMAEYSRSDDYTGVGTRKRAKWEVGSGPVQCQACDGKGLVWG